MGEGKNLIADLAGISEPLKKLIETVESGIGRVFKSTFTRQDADAKAYEIRVLAAAKADAMKLLSDGMKDAAPGTGGVSLNEDGISLSSLPVHEEDRLPSLPILNLEERTQSRQTYQESIRQQNIESITAIAAEQLRNESEIAPEPVDPDWTARFFRYSEDVSNEDMQTIWGKVLAGEIKNPGGFSYRAMELLRTLSKNEAEIFSQYSQYILSFDVKVDSVDMIFMVGERSPIAPYHRSLLTSAGIFAEELKFVIKASPTKSETNVFEIEDIMITVTAPINSKEANFNVLMLTKAGAELRKLINVKPDMKYLNELASKIREKDLLISIQRKVPSLDGTEYAFVDIDFDE